MIRKISRKLLWLDDDSKEEDQTEEAKYELDTNDPTIYKEHYPKQDYGSTMTLPDRRKLGYMIYGTLSNYKATIILLPGSPGTRLFNHETHHTINVLYGIRLIVIDRPGIGLSTKHDTYTFKSHAQDIHQLVQELRIQTYHIAAYSAGGPFGCAYCGLYSNNNSKSQLKSYHLISGVGPSKTPHAYGQMTMYKRIGWFVVKNSSKNVINFIANQDAKSNKKTPITGLVKEFGDNPCDEYMIKDPKVIRTFLMSKYETESSESGQESENRLLVLYGLPWEVALADIKCPVAIYNGTVDYGCVPNMAKYIFERISGKKAPDMPSKDDDVWEIDLEDDVDHKPSSKVAVDITEEEDDGIPMYEAQMYEAQVSVSSQIVKRLEHEYNENEKQQKVKNKHCELVWGKEKGHLWFFEEDLWRDVVCRVLFLESKSY